MQLFALPFFLFLLMFKNVKSWSRILAGAFGFQITILTLLLINVLIGGALFFSFQHDEKLNVSLEQAERRLSTQRKFWAKLNEETPGHTVISGAQKTLTQFETK